MQTILTLGNALNQGTARGRHLTRCHFSLYSFVKMIEDVIDELEGLTQDLSAFKDSLFFYFFSTGHHIY